MNEAKAILRKSLKQARLAMPADERQTKSLAINQKLLAVTDWSRFATIHVFEPISSLGEVDIAPFIIELTGRYPELHVYTSRQKDGDWHIYSVAANAPVPTASFDAVVVPMLGFNSSLHRVGFGGGYYDRLLASQPQAQTIGVCFEAGKVDHLPVEPHDIVLRTILTESGIYS